MAMLNNQRVTVNIFITSDQRTNMSNRHFLRENAPPKTEKSTTETRLAIGKIHHLET